MERIDVNQIFTKTFIITKSHMLCFSKRPDQQIDHVRFKSSPIGILLIE